MADHTVCYGGDGGSADRHSHGIWSPGDGKWLGTFALPLATHRLGSRPPGPCVLWPNASTGRIFFWPKGSLDNEGPPTHLAELWRDTIFLVTHENHELDCW